MNSLLQSTAPVSANSNCDEETQVGNHFVSNYPPYFFWTHDLVKEAYAALARQPQAGISLGIYLHIPFCRKRCHFCYFKVYTDKNSRDIERYLDAAIRELKVFSQKPFARGRKPKFLYFGGGTPSYISSQQLIRLVQAMREILPWDEAEEITFECEPGTLTEGKLKVIRDLGVTRLSLGVENFDDHVLQINGRAHTGKEIERAYSFARSLGFPQINIDLIAGMMGENAENWGECVRKTILCSPDSVTIYQMELPFNTGIARAMKEQGSPAPVVDWSTKREWVDYAFTELERAGYHIASAYTAVKDPAQSRFLYRDLLWSGADMIGLGVASFSHVGGTHFQNQPDIEPYMGKVDQDELPIYRAFTLNSEEVMIREFILQMKLGRISGAYFREKFGVDIQRRFASPLSELQEQGFLHAEEDHLCLNRAGLLRVDRLLRKFFLPQHRSARYT